jgi:hypothetical protein
MILHVPNVLTGEQVARCRETIMQSKWVDSRVTAGHQSALVKNNLQLPEENSDARELGEMILGALERHPLFISAALPSRVFPPIFNRYDVGMSLGTHLDNSVRQITGTPFRIPYRSRGYALPEPTGRVRWRGIGRRRCVRGTCRQVARRRDDPLSRDHFTSRHTGASRHQAGVDLLDTKYGPG